jgi:hypothetical protein
MKLYTEEQVRKIYCIAYLGGHSKYIMDFEEDVKLISPIELPSDRDIEIAANGNQEHYEGAMWLKYKYLTKTNNI